MSTDDSANPCADMVDQAPNYRRAWKLFRLMKDGSIKPLFIGKTEALPVAEWMDAKDIPTKGYAHRPGWHCTLTPNAPHLKDTDNRRVWLEVFVEDFVTYDRPESQGGTWVLSQRMYIDPLQPLFLQKMDNIFSEDINRYNSLIKSAFA